MSHVETLALTEGNIQFENKVEGNQTLAAELTLMKNMDGIDK